MTILVITTGGTIGGVAHENDNRAVYVKKNIVADYIQQNFRHHKLKLVELCNLDSTELTNAHIVKIAHLINSRRYQRVIIIHGTDTALVTARYLQHLVKNKQLDIRITGAFSPLTSSQSDGHANLIKAFGRNQHIGVSLVFAGKFFDPQHTEKRFNVPNVTNWHGRFYKTRTKHRPATFYRYYGPGISQRSAKTSHYTM